MNTLSRGYLPPTLPRNPKPHPGGRANLQMSQASDLAATILLLGHAVANSRRVVRDESGKSGGSGRARAYLALGILPLSNSSLRGGRAPLLTTSSACPSKIGIASRGAALISRDIVVIFPSSVKVR